MVIKPFRLGNIDQFEDPDAANERLNVWLDLIHHFFMESPEYDKLSKANRKGGGGWFAMFMGLYLNYIGEDLVDLDVEMAEEIMLDLYPSNLICSDTRAKTIVPELLAYWRFLDSAFNSGRRPRLKFAPAVIRFLESIRKDYLHIFKGGGSNHPLGDFKVMMRAALNPVPGDEQDSWICDLIADASRHLSEYKRHPAPPDHWLPLRQLPCVAQLLEYVCLHGYDTNEPNAADAVFELVSCACQDVFMQIRQGDSKAQAFWQGIEQQIINSSQEKNRLNADGMTVIFSVLSSHKQFLSSQFLDFIHQWHMDHVEEMAPEELTSEAVEESLLSMLEEIPDEFALVAALSEQLAFLPAEGLELITSALVSSEKGLNGTALMILDDNPERAECIASVLSQNPGGLTPITLARLIRIRNWLAKSVQVRVDKLIQAARKKGVVPAVPASLADSDILETYMTAVDGIGSQGAMMVVRDGQHYRLISFVLKEAVGIVDVMVTPALKKKQINQYVTLMRQQETSVERVSPDLVHRQLPFFLALNLKSGVSIDHELIQVMELLGIGDWNPGSSHLNCLYDALFPGTPSEGDIRSAQRRSEKWTQTAIGQSWVEIPQSPELLEIDNFFRDVIEPTRVKWSERIGRMALWAHYSANKNRQKQSRDYAVISWLLGRSDVPAREIRLLNAIARNSI